MCDIARLLSYILGFPGILSRESNLDKDLELHLLNVDLVDVPMQWDKAAMAEESKTYIIILNWNGWEDTIECLESVFHLNHPNFSVIVCDNASQDESLDRIEEWANGKIDANSDNHVLRHLFTPAYPKPIPFLRIEPQDDFKHLAERSERLFVVQPL